MSSITPVTPTPFSSSVSGTAYTNVYNVVQFGAVGDGSTDDAPAIQDAIDYANSQGSGTVYIPFGDYAVGATEVVMADNVKIIAEPGTIMRLTERITGYHGVITVPPGTDSWWIEGIEFIGLYSGTGAGSSPSNGGIWIWGATNGMVRDCVAHHFDYSGFNIFPGKDGQTDNASNITFQNCVGYSNAVDGFEINCSDDGVTPTSATADDIRFIHCKAYSNTYSGIELTGSFTTPGQLMSNITIDDFYSYSNSVDGVYAVPVSGNTIVELSLNNIRSNSNTGWGVNLGPGVNRSSLSNIACHSNESGMNIEGADIEAAGLRLRGNTTRGIRVTYLARRVNINGIKATGNGSGAAAGQAAIDVGVGGTGAEDINITGILCVDNGKEGVQYTSTVRGYVEGTSIGNGNYGLLVNGADRLHAQMSCINNTTAGMVGSGTPTRCALDLFLSDDGPGVQTIGWALNNGTNNHIREIYNDCSTPSNDSGTGTVNTAH